LIAAFTTQPKNINSHAGWNESSMRDLELFLPRQKSAAEIFYGSNHGIQAISLVSRLGSDGLHDGNFDPRSHGQRSRLSSLALGYPELGETQWRDSGRFGGNGALGSVNRWPDPALATETVFPGVSLAALQLLHEERHILLMATSRSTPTPLSTRAQIDGARRMANGLGEAHEPGKEMP
jgi:hypothetical protein